MWLADHLRGKDVFLLAGSNAEAAELSRRVQARLVRLGAVGPPQAPLADGNHAGTGDLVRARLNTRIDITGRTLTNRDTLKIEGWRGPDAEVRRQRLNGTWTGTFQVPRSYLAHSAELGLRRQRPRRPGPHRRHRPPPRHRHLVPAGPVRRHDPRPGIEHRPRRHRQAAPPGNEPYQQATPESVLADILQRDGNDLSATGQIRHAQEWAGGTGHLLYLWSAAVRQSLY